MQKDPTDIILISGYRSILGDTQTPDEVILERLAYLEGFCRGIIRDELKKPIKQYENSNK